MENPQFIDPSFKVESPFLDRLPFPREGEIFIPPTIYRYDKGFIHEHFDELMPPFLDVLTDSTGRPQDMEREVFSDVMKGWDFALALLHENELQGFGGFRINKYPGYGEVFDGAGKFIRRAMQGRKYGELITADAYRQTPDVNYFHLTTQNPASYLSFKRGLEMAGVEAVFAPIDVPYADDPELNGLFQTMLAAREHSDIDPQTGLRKNLYSGQRLGDFVVDESRREVAEVNASMLRTGLDREAGDGIFILGRKVTNANDNNQ